MNELYETRISNARWWAYDIPGNIGWILYLVFEIKCLLRGASVFAFLGIVPAALMLLGVGELVAERLAKLDRVLPRIRVLRGFGALALGGLLAAALAAIGLLAGAGEGYAPWMLLGGLLCTAFAWLCFKGYKKKET